MLGAQFTYSPKWDKTKNAEVTPIREAIMGPMRPALIATGGGDAAHSSHRLRQCHGTAARSAAKVAQASSPFEARLAQPAGGLMQQLMVEAALLGVAASIVGSALAMAGLRVMAEALPIGAWSDSAGIDPWMFVAALGIAVLAAMLVTIAPVVSLSRGDLQSVIGRARTGVQGRGGRLEKGLVVVEVALAMLVASAAALLVRSVDRTTRSIRAPERRIVRCSTSSPAPS